MAKRITTVNDVDPFDIADKFFIPLLTEAGYEVQYLITGRDNIRDSTREFDPHAIIINLPLGSLCKRQFRSVTKSRFTVLQIGRAGQGG